MMYQVSKDLDEITAFLKGEEEELPPSRPCGEGIYEILQHGYDGPLHFVYELELPTKLGTTLYLAT
jgi:hypothetical protein